MQLLNDPIRLRYACLGVLWFVLVPVVALLCQWAMVRSTINSEVPTAIASAPASMSTPQVTPSPIDTAVFDDRFWPEPTVVQEAPVVPPSVPPKPKLVLLAITTMRGDTYRANLYDPALDEILFAETGDRLGRVEVLEVNATSVRLKDRQGRLFRLELELES